MGIKLFSYVKTFLCKYSNKLAKDAEHVSENALLVSWRIVPSRKWVDRRIFFTNAVTPRPLRKVKKYTKNFFGEFFESKRHFTTVCVITAGRTKRSCTICYRIAKEDASHWKWDINTSFLTPLQLQIQISFTFQCPSGNLFSRYVKTISIYLIYTNNHGPNHTDAVAIVSRLGCPKRVLYVCYMTCPESGRPERIWWRGGGGVRLVNS